MKPVFFHKLNSEFLMTNHDTRDRRVTFVIRHSCFVIIQSGQQKTPSHRLRRGAGNGLALFSSFPEAPAPSWIWHLSPELRAPTGCRGVIGPVPQPLMMSSLISTNADILMPRDAGCQTVFVWRAMATNKSSKHQAPKPGDSSALCQNKTPDLGAALVIVGVWILELIWGLAFGTWCLGVS